MRESTLDAIRSGRAARVALQTLNQISRKRVWEPLNHRYGLPTVLQMSGGRAVFADPSAFLSALFPTADVPSLLAEHDEVQTKLTQRRARADLVYGESFDVGQGTSLCLYGMTRILKPAHVLETGVADGVSSFVFLAAMDRNGTGTLHSTDIRPNAGALVNSRDHWDLFLVDRRTPARSLAKYVRSLPPLDLFVHDSLHLRAWQLLELRLATPISARVASSPATTSTARSLTATSVRKRVLNRHFCLIRRSSSELRGRSNRSLLSLSSFRGRGRWRPPPLHR